MLETASAAAIGATVSAIGTKKLSALAIARLWLSGFFLAFFTADDVVNAVQHIFSFNISKGGTVFLLALFGSAAIEKCLFLINSFKLTK